MGLAAMISESHRGTAGQGSEPKTDRSNEEYDRSGPLFLSFFPRRERNYFRDSAFIAISARRGSFAREAKGREFFIRSILATKNYDGSSVITIHKSFCGLLCTRVSAYELCKLQRALTCASVKLLSQMQSTGECFFCSHSIVREVKANIRTILDRSPGDSCSACMFEYRMADKTGTNGPKLMRLQPKRHLARDLCWWTRPKRRLTPRLGSHHNYACILSERVEKVPRSSYVPPCIRPC